MALSNQRVVSNGTLVTLDISFDFFDHEEIGVYFDSVPQLPDAGVWFWGSETSISFYSPVPAGIEVMIQRKTDASELRHEFSKGSEFKVDTLDENFRQVLHIVQEATESNFSKDFFDDINMNGFQIYNLGPATQDNHAISLGDVKTQSAAAWVAASQSASSRDAAAASAATANAAAGAANTSATTADGHRQAAAASASSASGSATTATQQAQGASASASAAAGSATSAFQSATTASNWAALTSGPVSGGEYSAKWWAQQSQVIAFPDGYITQGKLAAALSTKVDHGEEAYLRNFKDQALSLNAGTDLNGDYVSGEYIVNTNSNTPRNVSGYWMLYITRGDASTIVQRVVHMSGNTSYVGSTWMRIRTGGVWQPWVEVGFVPEQKFVYLSGNAASPGVISVAHYSPIANPYPGWLCAITPQIYLGGQWGDPKFASNAGTGSLSYGLSAAQMDDGGQRNFIIRAGTQAVHANSAVTGSPFQEAALVTSAPFRLLVVKQCRPPA